VLTRDFNAVTLSNRLFDQLVGAEAGVRGYALTGDPSALAPFHATQSKQAAADGAHLRSLVAGNAGVRAALQRAGASASAWYTRWAIPTIAQVQRSGTSSVTKADITAGQRLFQRVRNDYTAYIGRLVASRNAGSHSLRLRTRVLLGIVIGAAVALAIGGAALWIGLRRWVLRPLLRLADETRTVRSGDVSHHVEFHGPAEIEALAADVESMRERLVTEIDESAAARARIEEAHVELAEQAEELQRSNRDLEQFAYVASHDLQEPLRKVASFCQLLERRYKGQLDERADQYIAFAVDGAKRMQQLINDLLAFSRVGRLTSGFAEVALADCLASALRNLAAAIEASEAEVTADDLPVVQGEATLLVQLLQNLIGNAVKFRGPEAPRVHIGAHRDGDTWEFSCADNGIGIEPQYAERIFVIFQRLHPKDEYEGTGIGLAMCKKIVEYHGGHIWLDTTVERGTTFRWTIPVAEPPEQDEPEASDRSDDSVSV
jgi:signal transduction histidine kinase